MTVSWGTNSHEHLTSLESASIPEILQRCAFVCESGGKTMKLVRILQLYGANYLDFGAGSSKLP